MIRRLWVRVSTCSSFLWSNSSIKFQLELLQPPCCQMSINKGGFLQKTSPKCRNAKLSAPAPVRGAKIYLFDTQNAVSLNNNTCIQPRPRVRNLFVHLKLVFSKGKRPGNPKLFWPPARSRCRKARGIFCKLEFQLSMSHSLAVLPSPPNWVHDIALWSVERWSDRTMIICFSPAAPPPCPPLPGLPRPLGMIPPNAQLWPNYKGGTLCQIFSQLSQNN